MKKHFICLANSFKYAGRCLGGIEIEMKDNKYTIVRNENGTPKWIRPVSFEEHGQLPASETRHINILDIIEVDITETCPKYAHSENIHYSNLVRKTRCSKQVDAMDNLCDNIHKKIFYNCGKAVPTNVFQEGKYSLMLIKPDSPQIYYDSDTNKYRAKFTYENIEYDFPITDPYYIDLLKHTPSLCVARKTGELYFIISLGEELDEWHYKLIAGIIDMKIED